MKSQHLIYCIAIIAVLFTACKRDKETDIEVRRLTVNEHLPYYEQDIYLGIGDTITLMVTIEPETATNKNVMWKSRDPKIATVSDNGLVTAIAEGKTYITAISQEKPDIHSGCSVIVSNQIPATGITLNKHALLLAPDETETLIATLHPEDVSNKNKTWTSSNSEVATVSSGGKVTAITEGEVIVTVTTYNNTFIATCHVTVGKELNSTTGITLNKSELFLTIGNTETLVATIEPENATYKNVVWTSSNSSVATVNSDGVVTAIADGKANIIATTQDGKYADNCSVAVSYRSQWVGDWDFEIIWYSWRFDEETQYRDPVYYLGKIRLGENDNELIIDYSEGVFIVMKVDENGKLSDTYYQRYYYCYGQFEGTDKVEIKYGSGGLGGGSGFDMTGIKSKRGGGK